MRLTLSKKIIIVIEIGVVSSILLFGITVFFFLQSNIKDQIDSRLESISSLKLNYIKEQLNFLVLEIESTVKSNHIKMSLIDLLKNKSKDNGDMVTSMIPDGMIKSSSLINFYIINNDGIIIKSNNKEEEGKINPNELYFIKGKGKTNIQSFIYDISTKQIITIIATPIKDTDGTVLGILAEEINTNDINKIMSDRSGLGKTGETFLINSFNFVTTDLLKEKDAALKKTIYLPQVNTCLKGNSGFYQMNDYHGDKIYGYARYFPEINSCLISKIDESELLEPIKKMLPEIIFFILIICTTMLILGYIIGQSILRPLKVLRDQAVMIKDGNMDITIESKSNDEVGDMATSFKEMLIKLKELYFSLEDKVKERTKKIEEVDLKLKNTLEETKKLNKLMVGRELKMIELKQENLKLKEEKGVKD